MVGKVQIVLAGTEGSGYMQLKCTGPGCAPVGPGPDPPSSVHEGRRNGGSGAWQILLTDGGSDRRSPGWSMALLAPLSMSSGGLSGRENDERYPGELTSATAGCEVGYRSA